MLTFLRKALRCPYQPFCDDLAHVDAPDHQQHLHKHEPHEIKERSYRGIGKRRHNNRSHKTDSKKQSAEITRFKDIHKLDSGRIW